MKILKIFINNFELTNIEWQLIVPNEETLMGVAIFFEELNALIFTGVEVYLNPELSSVIAVDLNHISDRKINNEYLLSAIEENTVDDIEHLSPILLKIEGAHSYVALFNHEFYSLLLEKITSLDAPIKFVQSIVYSTEYQEGVLTVYNMGIHKYLRINKYQYYLLDDNTPIPLILSTILNTTTFTKIVLYDNNNLLINELLLSYPNLIIEISNNFNSELVWNFYNKKTKKFQIKLNAESWYYLKKFTNLASYFMIFLFIYYLLNLIILSGQNIHYRGIIHQQLAELINDKNIDQGTAILAKRRLEQMAHDRGLYAETDMLPLLKNFLSVVPTVGISSINKIIYDNNQLIILVDASFQQNNFISYQNIFKTMGINATIDSYRNYKTQNNKSNNNDGSGNENIKNEPDAVWVITLNLMS